MTSRLTRYEIKWILKDKIPIPITDLMEWGRWMEKHERMVARTDIDDEVTVSTVFLGLDHQYSDDPDAPPILFETMVFGEETTLKWPSGRLTKARESVDGYFQRYSTYAEAQKGHEEVCESVRKQFAAALQEVPKGATS